MLRDPPAVTIETLTSILLACEKPASIRQFAGWSVGKRRDLRACASIAGRIAPRYQFPLSFKSNGRDVSAAELVDVLEGVLRAVTDERAFALVSKDADQRAVVRREIASQAAKQLTSLFEVTRIDNETDGLRRSSGGAGMWWETGQMAP